MHSCETLATPPAASGPSLLLQLGRLIMRSRSPAPRPERNIKVVPAKPSTSTQVQTQPKAAEDLPQVEAQLSDHVNALWNDQLPVCIEVLLAPDCQECYTSLCREDSAFDKHKRALLLERWSIQAQLKKGDRAPAFSTSQWLLNAVRSQLHFSQLSAWLSRLNEDTPDQRRRKLSHETCNFKKLEGNCDATRNLNIVYSIQSDTTKTTDFTRTPTDHKFPLTDIGNNLSLNITLQSLPRIDDIPSINCSCPKRKTSRDIPINIHEDIVGKFNDLTLDKKLVDDRMHTPCSENGKHKCYCDDESDSKDRKKEDKRLKEIAKHKRKMRKECKMKKLHDSTSSEGDKEKSKETHTSIPILQAARFDRFRAIGCYRNQTYLTLCTPKMESKPPFCDTENIAPAEFKKTATIGTQTEDVACNCGGPVYMVCSCCDRGMVRSNATYDLTALGARRKSEDDEKASKKLKCDTNCDNISIVSNNDLIKRPKLRRALPIVEKIERIVTDRARERDIEVLKLDERDSVFSKPRESKRQKTYSVGEDYVLYEKCDYGSFDCSNEESPKEETKDFKFPESPTEGAKGVLVPTLNEMDKFRWRFDSAASMVFHSKTGLPLTSSPAPLRRGNNCFEFDDSINGISGIKSALFHPTPETPEPVIPETPEIVDSVPTTPPLKKKDKNPKLRIGPSTCLLGSFEESALKGRLEPVATVHGFTAELAAYGAFCPPHRKLPVTVFFYAPGGTNAPYMGHISLCGGYRVPPAGTVQLSLFNPHGTLVKMFVVLYELSRMPAAARTFLRQRTHALPPGQPPGHASLRYLIHLRFMTSKSGKLYLHTDIRIIVSRKADLDTATAHSALFRPLPTSDQEKSSGDQGKSSSDQPESSSDQRRPSREPNRVFGGCSEFDFRNDIQNVGYELRSFTYAPDNPKYSPR